MNKTELLKELESLIEKLDNDVLTNGEESAILSRIQITQSKLQTVHLTENIQNTSRIIRISKKTSRNTVIISLLTIAVSIFSLINTLSGEKSDCKSDLNQLKELLFKEVEILEILTQKLDKTVFKNDYE